MKCVNKKCTLQTFKSRFCKYHEWVNYRIYLEKKNKNSVLMKMRKKKKINNRVNKIFYLYKSGLTQKQVSEKLGLTIQRVHQLLKTIPIYKKNRYKRIKKIARPLG